MVKQGSQLRASKGISQKSSSHGLPIALIALATLFQPAMLQASDTDRKADDPTDWDSNEFFKIPNLRDVVPI